MRYESIELIACKRLQVRNIRRFFARFDNPLQIILGTNGTGKSSILAELTPLPSSKHTYFEGGGKRIIAHHGNSEYVFSSQFHGKEVHSFKKDGVELNPGGTSSVQKLLCKQEFNITPDSHLLMLGKKRFTQMEIAERRMLFTTMSDNNFDFALKLFQRLKVRARDVSGTMKRTRERLGNEASRQISIPEQTRIKKEVQDLHDALTLLLDNRSPITKPIVDCERDLQEAVHSLTDLSKRLFMLKFEAPYGTNELIAAERDDWGVLKPVHYTSISHVDESINIFQRELAVSEALINDIYLQTTKLKESKDVLEKSGTEGVESLKVKLENLREQRDNKRASSKLKLVFSDPIEARSALAALSPTLREVFESIPVNDERQFTGSGRDSMDKNILDLKETIRQQEVHVNRLIVQREHMESHKKNSHLACPKCNHQWSEGYDEAKFQGLVKQVEDLSVSLAEMHSKLKTIEKDREAFNDYSAHYRRYSQSINANSVLKPFWDYLSNKQTITHYPRSGVNELFHLEATIDTEIEALKLEREIVEVENLIKAVTSVGDQNLNEVVAKMTELQIKSDKLTDQMVVYRSAITKHQTYRRQLSQSEEISARIEEQIANVESIRTETVEMIRRDTLNHCIRQLQSTLSSKEETLKSMEMQAILIADLEKSINSLTLEDEAMKLLVKEMSPTEGLIAEGLLGFIVEFTKKMNGLIKEIWTYPLVIHTCQPNDQGEAELDFEFPVSVSRKDNVIPDVRDGSTGIKEILDLAFRIASMGYLGLVDFPLILDEFGNGLDEVHTVEAGQAVKRLIEHYSFSQLFMISHYSASYGSIHNAQICVLCPENVTVPETMKHNQHVVIE